VRKFKPKACTACAEVFPPRSASHARCDSCAQAHKALGRGEYNAAYREANRERLIAADRDRYTKDEIAEKSRQYRERHPEAVAARKAAYYQANRDRIIANEAARYASDAERIQQVQREWRAKNQDALRGRGQRRRALKASVECEKYRPLDIFERDGWDCQLCSEPIDRSAPWPAPRSPSIDHIVPLVAGGGDMPNNVQASHLGCNLRKGRKVLSA